MKILSRNILLLLVVVLLSISNLCAANSLNAGMIAVIHQEEIDHVKEQVFDYLLKHIQNFKLSNIRHGDFKVHHLKVNIDVKEENVHINLNEENNSVILKIEDFSFEITGDANIKKKWFNIDGKIDIKGMIKHASTEIGFSSQEKGMHLIPKFETIGETKIELDEDNLHLNIECHACGSPLMDLIESLIKGDIIKLFEEEMVTTLKEKVIDWINDKLLENYQAEFLIHDLIGIAMGITKAFEVIGDSIVAYIDGTIFSRSEGYERDTDSSEIATLDHSNVYSTIFILGKYVFKTLENAMQEIKMSFEHTLEKYEVLTIFDGEVHEFKITPLKDKVKLEFQADFYIPEKDIEVLVDIEGEISLEFLPGDDDYMMYLKPKIIKDTIKTKVDEMLANGKRGNLPEDFNVEELIKDVIDKFKPESIGFKQPQDFVIKLVKGVIKFFEDHIELDVDIKSQ